MAFVGRAWRFLSDLSIFLKLFFGITLIILPIIFISTIMFYSYSKNLYAHEAEKNVFNLVVNLNTSFTDNLDQMDRIIASISSDENYWRSLSDPADVDMSKEYTNMTVIRKYFEQMIYLRKDLLSLYLYISPAKSFSYYLLGSGKENYNPVSSDWFNRTMAANGKTVMFPPHLPYQLNGDKEVISFSRKLMTYYGDPCVILLDISTDSLKDIVMKAGLNPGTSVLFLDNKGDTVYSDYQGDSEPKLSPLKQKQIMGTSSGNFTDTIGGIPYLITYTYSEVTGWKLVTLTPYSTVVQDGKKLLLFSILLSMGGILIAMLMAYGFSKYMYLPLHSMKAGMNRVKRGDLQVQLTMRNNDELGQLVGSFNAMVSDIRQLIAEKYEETIARKDAEFKFLQAQINPHFIYNTLQIISSIAVVKKVPEINMISKNLAKIIRYSVSSGQRLIPLSEELQNVVYYLDIQKQRFKNKLDVTVDVDEAAQNCGILKLSLQPIVENAVVHGLGNKAEGGKLQIRASREQDMLVLKVTDTGVGLSAEKVAYLMRVLSDAVQTSPERNQTTGNHIGLQNIHRRIQLLYGEQYGLTIESETGEWTTVTLTTPAIQFEQES